MGPLRKVYKETLRAFITGIAVLLPVEIFLMMIGWIIVTLDKNFQPLLKFLLPDNYVFPLAGMLLNATIFILAGFLLKSRLRPAIDKIFLNIPIVKYVWRTKSGNDILESAIPARAIFMDAGTYSDGFIMGKETVEDETEFLGNKILYIMYFASAPIPLSGMPILRVEAQKVREIELVDNPDRNAARLAILNNTTSFGSSVTNMRLKIVDDKDIPLQQPTKYDLIRFQNCLKRLAKHLS